ncbi:MAG: MBL fold metallo-hydrolase [Candidatus Heimdallarchaeota archaeon]|nr:MBL fold metallo-hydrolase [Candidatus Heimdallarchaeota archaeon]
MVKLTFLGTGNAFGDDGRRPSAYLIEGSRTILMDSGPSVGPALKKQGKTIHDIDVIILSHLHPDHYLGIPQMTLENFYVTKRTNKIPILAPYGARDLFKQVCTLLYDDTIAAHIDELFDIQEVDVDTTTAFSGGSLTTIMAEHAAGARMLQIELDGKIVGYTGDSSFIKESLYRLMKGDVVITEATSSGFNIPYHTSLEEIQSLVVPDGCRVFLSHLGSSVIVRKNEIHPPFFVAEDDMTIEI